MRNSLRYSINDHFYVEATLENSKYQETFKTLILRLCSVNDHSVIGKTKFLWPEHCLPNEITANNEKQIIVLRGVDNIAKIPIKVPIKCSLYTGGSEDSVPSVSVHASFSSFHKTEAIDSLALRISDCLTEVDLSIIWNELSKLTNKADVDSVSNLPITLPAHMQMTLVKVLRKYVNEELFDRVLSLLVQSRLITESKACCKLVELLASKNLISHAIDFLHSSLIIDDQTYAAFLKISSNESLSESVSLILALLKKPINSCGLQLAISQKLTEAEVTTIIERLISLACDKKRDYLFDKILKLKAILIDSHSQRFIWDEKCHSIIRDAACFASTMAQVIDMFRHLEQQLEQRKEIVTDVPEINSDYIIRKITFAQKLI